MIINYLQLFFGKIAIVFKAGNRMRLTFTGEPQRPNNTYAKVSAPIGAIALTISAILFYVQIVQTNADGEFCKMLNVKLLYNHLHGQRIGAQP